MKKPLLTLCSLLLCSAAVADNPFFGNIIVGDQKATQVSIMKPDVPWHEPQACIWSWSPAHDGAIASDKKPLFNNISDVRATEDGQHVLVTASGGGIALVELKTKSAVFQAYVKGNPHASTILPGQAVAIASSHGNTITVVTRKDNGAVPHASCTVELADAHGVVWDAQLGLLWALGFDKLNAYRYNQNTDAPELTLVQSFTPAKDFGGHDLTPAYGRPHTLYLTGKNTIFRFDTTLGRCKTFRKLENVKAISRHPDTGSVIYLTPKQSWVSDSITELTSPQRTWTLPEAQFYKARWFHVR